MGWNFLASPADFIQNIQGQFLQGWGVEDWGEDVEINGPLHFLGIFTSRFGYRIRISYGVCSRVQYLMVFLEILIETNA